MFKLGIDVGNSLKKKTGASSSKKRGRNLNTGSPVQRKRARERETDKKTSSSKVRVSPLPSPTLDRVKPDRLVSLSDESEESDSESEIQLVHQSNEETIDVAFDFTDFEENDYHGTRNLLTRSIVFNAILDPDNLAELADTWNISQSRYRNFRIRNVVKVGFQKEDRDQCEEEEDEEKKEPGICKNNQIAFIEKTS